MMARLNGAATVPSRRCEKFERVTYRFVDSLGRKKNEPQMDGLTQTIKE